MSKQATLKLASGHEMPQVGFGLWKVPRDSCADTVYNAIKVGYRLFDGAYDYQNEKEAGQGIKRAIDEGLVKREDIFVTTKLWNNYHSKENAIKMAKSQNESWGLGYIDLYLIHFPVSLKYIDPSKKEFPGWTMEDDNTVELEKSPVTETWKGLEEIVDQGIAKSIGVSNFQAQLLYELHTLARHPVSALQIEIHPYLANEQLVKLAQSFGIAVTAYSSFGPLSYHELGGTFDNKTKDLPILFENQTITKIAEKNKKTPAQVLLRWSTTRLVMSTTSIQNMN
jgi:D-xylose reductase